MLFFHIATQADWSAAHLEGAYTASTLGVTLEEEGFIHCSRYFQVSEILDNFYADHDGRLVLLTVNPRRLTSPWRFDHVPEAGVSFPHIYGQIGRAHV